MPLTKGIAEHMRLGDRQLIWRTQESPPPAAWVEKVFTPLWGVPGLEVQFGKAEFTSGKVKPVAMFTGKESTVKHLLLVYTDIAFPGWRSRREVQQKVLSKYRRFENTGEMVFGIGNHVARRDLELAVEQFLRDVAKIMKSYVDEKKESA